MVDHYTTLGVSRRANKHEIKDAYRRLALKLHPDKNLGSPAACAAFQKLLTAYEELHDERRRAIYDALLHETTMNPTYGPDDPNRCSRAYDYQAHEWTHQPHQHQQRQRHREKLRRAHSEETWPARERAALARIALAKTHLAAVKADIRAWKCDAKQRRKHERQVARGGGGRGLWKYLASSLLLLFASTTTTVAQEEEREERLWKWGGLSVRLGFARMELERCKEALGAMRRMRKQVRREGGVGWRGEWWGEGEEEEGWTGEGGWYWDADATRWMQDDDGSEVEVEEHAASA